MAVVTNLGRRSKLSQSKASRYDEFEIGRKAMDPEDNE